METGDFRWSGTNKYFNNGHHEHVYVVEYIKFLDKTKKGRKTLNEKEFPSSSED